MATFNPRRFVNVEILRQVDQDRLIEFLRKYEAYLKGRGFSFEKNEKGELEFDTLVRILLDPTDDVEIEFIDQLSLLHDVAQARRFDDLRDQAAAAGLIVPNEATPADVALQIIIHDPGRLRRMQAEGQIARPKTYIHFVSDAEPPEDFPSPTEEDRQRIAAAMDNFFAQNRGGRGCRIFVNEDPDGGRIQFLISHGMQFKREGSIVDGKPSSVLYRPEHHDVVIYDVRRNRLSIYNKSQAKRERETYARVFGSTFFGDTAYFYRDELFTLAPLREKGKGALVCSDIDGIDEVRLIEIHVKFKNPFNESYIRKSTDLFASLDAANEKFPQNGELEEAKFEFKMSGSNSAPTATIAPFGRTRYDRSHDGLKIEEFFEKRGFMIPDDVALLTGMAA